MTTRNYIVATAGHVDHGKSALVKALTGIDPDRLPEEKARGITIDLGFAHLEIEAPAGAAGTVRYDLGMVDVPGHEDFVKNMVAGVGSVDLALFVVAADDGWMPQTEEHLQILTYLGVRRAVVALSKIDLAQDEAASVARIRERLADSPFARAPIVPTSVLRGRGLNELRAALAEVFADTPLPCDTGKPRLAVDRVFTLRGIGTVVTGTLAGGVLRRGQAVRIQPSGASARIRSLQNHHRDVEACGPGTRTALNLSTADDTASGISRGEVVTFPESGTAGRVLDVALVRSARLAGGPAAGARPLKDGALVRIHLGTTNVPARVLLAGGGPLTPGGQAVAELRCESPLFAFVGDRFIVRDWAEQATLAGGVVLEPDADRERFRTPAQQEFLLGRSRAPGDLSVLVKSQLARDGAAVRVGLLKQSRFADAEIEGETARLAAAGRAVDCGGFVADADWWRRLREEAIAAIDAAHRAHPDQPGLPLNALRSLVERRLPSAGVFNALLAGLARDGFFQDGTVIRRAAHQPTLPPHLDEAAARLRALLSAKPLETPSRKELAPDGVAQQALRFLVRTGEAIELGEDVVLSGDAFARARETVATYLRSHGSAGAGELRQALGTSRRIVIPLLERLDRDGVTRREGDKRILKLSQEAK